MTYHAKTPQQTMADLSSSVRGLDDAAVAERLGGDPVALASAR